ncbi:restriction endonuclease subunit S [Stutzerimonas stutzeri]|uniref:restriction endonuclease subunit S n=1 Tax=Stutzerimonas stutzeri TaxID=316 RepID=UPI0022446EDA
MSWPLAKLDNHVDILSGFAFKSENFNDRGEGLPLVRIRDVVPGVSDTYYSGEYSSEFLLSDGDLLIGMDGDFNRARWNGGQALLNQRVCKVTAKGESLDQGYLYHFLPKALDKIHAETPAVTVKHLSVKGIRAIEIPLPPLPEQKRIAAILDKADAIRRKRQQAIQLADDFLRAVFLEMFGDPVTNPKGWIVRPLGELAKSFQNGIGKGKEYYGSGEKVANISDLYKAARFAPEEYSLLDVSLEEVAKYRLARGDLLFVRSSVKREGVAYCSMYDSDEVCLFGSFMIRMIVDDLKVLPEFLSLQLRMPSQRVCLVNASNTATITNISQDGLSGIEVVVPPISEQRAFLDKHKSILEVLRKESCFLDQSNNIFSSLSQKGFSGQL